MLLYGVSFAEELKPGDVLATSQMLTNDRIVVSILPDQVKRIDKADNGAILVELSSHRIMVLQPSQSVIVGREPQLRDVS
jgi:hypothetical protein